MFDRDICKAVKKVIQDMKMRNLVFPMITAAAEGYLLRFSFLQTQFSVSSGSSSGQFIRCKVEII